MARRRRKWVEEQDLVKRDGALVLTFVNTSSRRSPRLRSYDDLLTWAGEYGDLRSTDASRLRKLAAERVDGAAAVFATAEELHDVLSRIVNAAVDNFVASAASVETLNALLQAVTPRRMLIPTPKSVALGWDWPEDPERDLFRPLWAVAASAMDLMTSEDSGRVKRCAAEDCGALFMPRKGPGMPRKWCSSRACSDPARSREYYYRVTKPARAAVEKNFQKSMKSRRQ